MKFESVYKNYTLGNIQFINGVYETEIQEEIEVLTKDSSVYEFLEDPKEIEKLREEKENAEKVAQEVLKNTDKAINRILELIQLNKEQQLELIVSLNGTDDGRGSAVDRIKKIIELEKGQNIVTGKQIGRAHV